MNGGVLPLPADPVFHALSDPTRRALFERLCRGGEQTVGGLTAGAGVSQPVVSRHLGVLRCAGLVLDRRTGRQTHYRPAQGGLTPLADWTAQMTRFWGARLDALDDLVKRMDK